MEDIKKIAQKYGEAYSTKITRQGIGVGMIQNPKYNNGKPWFIHFRPTLHNPHKISASELEQYSEYSYKLDYLDMLITRAKAYGIKVDDMALELKLTRDKLKEGHFKMVDIYLASLIQNISNIPQFKKYVSKL